MNAEKAEKILDAVSKMRKTSIDTGISYLDGLLMEENESEMRDFLYSQLMSEHWAAGQFKQAVEIAERRLQERPDHVCYSALSAAYERTGQISEARSAALEAFRLAEASSTFIRDSALGVVRLLLSQNDIAALREFLAHVADSVPTPSKNPGTDCKMEWDWTPAARKMGIEESLIHKLRKKLD